MNPLYHKIIQWYYENEYRIIKPDFVGVREFNPKAISIIILGYRASSDDILKIKDEIKENELSHIKLSKAIKGDDIKKFNTFNVNSL